MKTLKNLLIVGTGDFAREVYWHAQNSIGYGEDYMIKGFLEGNIPLQKESYKMLPLPVFENVSNYVIQEGDVFVIAIANTSAKAAIAEILEAKNAQFINIVHKTAMVADDAKIGKDIILCQFTTVSSNVEIRDHVMLNAYTSLGHDAVLGKYSSCMGHVDITGHVVVGEGTYWGSGSRALPSSKIGDYAKVGAGSVVLRKVKAGQTVFGVPAVSIN